MLSENSGIRMKTGGHLHKHLVNWCIHEELETDTYTSIIQVNVPNYKLCREHEKLAWKGEANN